MTNTMPKAADLRALAARNPSDDGIQALTLCAFQGSKTALTLCAQLIVSGR